MGVRRSYYLMKILNTVDQFIDFRDINILQIRIEFTHVFKASYAYIEAACLVIVNLNIEVIHLIKAYSKATVIPFCQKNPIGRKYLGLGHSVHKIKIPYIHKAIFCVLVPGSA
jgi:hypothetical protein